MRLAIVDDDPIVREALHNVLRRTGQITPVAKLATGEAAVEHAASPSRADVYLMDLHMSGMDGLSAAIAIKAMHPEARVIVLTSVAAEGTRAAAIAVGVDAFLLKTSAPQDIAASILGSKPKSPTSHEIPQLTEREQQILQLLCWGRSNAAIAAELHLSESRVKSHMGVIMGKLGVESRLQAVVTALKLDLCRL